MALFTTVCSTRNSVLHDEWVCWTFTALRRESQGCSVWHSTKDGHHCWWQLWLLTTFSLLTMRKACSNDFAFFLSVMQCFIAFCPFVILVNLLTRLNFPDKFVSLSVYCLELWTRCIFCLCFVCVDDQNKFSCLEQQKAVVFLSCVVTFFHFLFRT